MYGDVKPPDDSAASPESDTETVDQETEQTENTAILPNKILMGPDGQAPKEGDRITLEVVKVYGDEAEVRASSQPKETSPEMGQSSDSEIEAMDQPEMM